VRWRTCRPHHEVQQKGRDEILADYHLRIGQITADNQVPPGYALSEQRLDETEVGEGTTVTLINAPRPAEWKRTNNAYECAERLGLNPWAAESTSWDIFDAFAPGDLILLMSWKNAAAAQAYEDTSVLDDSELCASSSAKSIMGSGRAIPSEPPSLAHPRAQALASDGGGEGGVHPFGGPERWSGRPA
jgi:hypothetical protein